MVASCLPKALIMLLKALARDGKEAGFLEKKRDYLVKVAPIA
jgi:hypothetical protein